VERDAVDFINTKMLIRHALAFGLYMLTILMYNASLCYWGWKQTPESYYIATILGTLFNIGSTISQLLLCQIMWSLGTAVIKPKPTEVVIVRQEPPPVNKTMQMLLRQ
jgi:uncharacterized membrane protein YciS (DUF1049 family)